MPARKMVDVSGNVKPPKNTQDFVFRAAPGTSGRFSAKLVRLDSGEIGLEIFGQKWRAPKGFMRDLVYCHIGDVLDVETSCNPDGSGRTWRVR